MAGLPKKYAKMGFKRGWAAYKRTKTRSYSKPVKRVNKSRRSVGMARRRRTYTRARKYTRRARTSGGSFKPIIDGVLAGAGGTIATKFLGQYGHPAATLGVGWFRKNNVLMTEGARELGILLTTNMFGGAGSNSGFLGG